MSKKQTQWSRNFNNKTYKMLSVRLPIQLVDDFKSECQKRSVPQAQVIRQALENFLEEEKNMKKGYIITLLIFWESLNQSEFFAYYKNGNFEEISEMEFTMYNDYNIDPDYLSNADDDYEKREQPKLHSSYCFETKNEAEKAIADFEKKLEEKKGYFLTNTSGIDFHSFEICEVLC